MRALIFTLAVVLAGSQSAWAGPIYYNFTGTLDEVYDYDERLTGEREITAGDRFQAIYTLDPDAPLSAGTIGSSPYRKSEFRDAILNFSFYVDGLLWVDSDYRIQTFRNLNGYWNDEPTDWLEFRLTGHRDNYSDDYGLTPYGEYITNRFDLVDRDGTAHDQYNLKYEGNIPLTLDLADYEDSYFSIRAHGPASNSSLFYQLRGSVDGFSSTSEVMAVPAPPTLLLVGIGCCLLLTTRRVLS